MASLVAKTNCEEPREFSDFVSQLTEGLCVDFPMYLHRVASTFKAFESSLDLHVVTVATFYSQLMLTDSIIETSLLGKVKCFLFAEKAKFEYLLCNNYVIVPYIDVLLLLTLFTFHFL